MTHHPHPIAHFAGPYPPGSVHPTDWQVLVDAAKTGAIVGTAGAAALNLHRMQREGISWQAALRGTAEAGLYAGIATAVATAVGRMAGPNPLLTLAATLTTGTALMYALTRRRKEHDDA